MVKVKIYLDKVHSEEYDKASTPSDCVAFALKCSALIVKTINDKNISFNICQLKKKQKGVTLCCFFSEERESYGEK